MLVTATQCKEPAVAPACKEGDTNEMIWHCQPVSRSNQSHSAELSPPTECGSVYMYELSRQCRKVCGLLHSMASRSATSAHSDARCSDFLTVSAAPVWSPHRCQKERQASYQFVDYTSIEQSSSATSVGNMCMRVKGRLVREAGSQTDRYLIASLVAEHVLNSTLDGAQQDESNSNLLHALLAVTRSCIHQPSSIVTAVQQDVKTSHLDNASTNAKSVANISGVNCGCTYHAVIM